MPAAATTTQTMIRSGWIRYIALLPWLVLVISLLITYFLRIHSQNQVHDSMQTEFDARSHEAVNLIHQHMLGYERLLYGARGLFAASHDVTRNEFEAYFDQLQESGLTPGIQGLGFALIVPAAQKSTHIAAMRREGYAQYSIRPEGVRDLYTAIDYVAPSSRENLTALGYDMYSDLEYPHAGDINAGGRHDAMALSRDLDKPVITSRVKLLTDAADSGYTQAGFLMFLPVYRNGAPLASLAERRTNIVGWVYIPFHMDDLMADILAEMTHDFDIEVHDGESLSPQNIMYDPDMSSTSGQSSSMFVTTSREEIAHHYWMVTVRSLDLFETRLNSDKPGFLTYAGIISSLLLSLLAWLLVYSRERALRDAKSIEQSQILLSTIIDTALDAVVQIDADGCITAWNKQAEHIFGWTGNAAIGRLLQETIIPAKHRKFYVKGMQSFLQTGSGPMLNKRVELTAQHMDGHEFPVEVSVTHFKAGNRILFTFFIRDITERKLAEQALLTSEQRFRDVSEATGEYLWELDANMVYTYVSNRSAGIKGYAPEELINRSPADFMPIEDLAPFTKAVNDAIANKTPFKVQHRNLARNGDVLWEEVTGLPILDADGNVVGLRGAGLDITRRKQAEEELQLASMVFKNSSEAMVVTDASNRIISVNPAFEELTGYTLAEVLGRDPKILSSGKQDKAFYQTMWQEINTSGTWQGELWDKRKNGEIYPKSLTINTIKDEKGQVHRYVALFSDITKKKESEELIWNQANFDILTGLPNRNMFRDRLDQEIKKAHRTGGQLALMLLDLDHFKEINDTLGHDMGDVLLKEAATRLSNCVRESDTVARLGGDEFIIILSDLDDPGSVDRISSDILKTISDPFNLDGELGYISTSIGITLYPADAKDIETLLKNADQAMYVAKKQGRNRSSYFTQSMQESAQSRMRLINDLRNATIAGDQFFLHYQPIVELASNTVRKAEALLRWKHPSRGLVLPYDFIPATEETGMIAEIGDWVFHQAVSQVLQWKQSRHADFQISINVSPIQFKSSGGFQHWFEHLNSLGLPRNSISVEITEGLLLEASATTIDQLLDFRDEGIQVSIDDFGTGYSSLSYLKRFDIDYLKIDQSFVRNLDEKSDDLALCTAIIEMAHRLGIKVIAEGIETSSQRDLLISAGCDYGQGFLFSESVPADRFDAVIDRFAR